MKALLDTNVLSEIGKDDGNPTVKAGVAEIPAANLYVSVLTVGEIAKGIALRTPGKKRKILESWLLDLETEFAGRILNVDLETARIGGEMTARARQSGIVILELNGLIAATAMRHGLHAIAQNSRDFEASGALIIDP